MFHRTLLVPAIIMVRPISRPLARPPLLLLAAGGARGHIGYQRGPAPTIGGAVAVCSVRHAFTPAERGEKLALAPPETAALYKQIEALITQDRVVVFLTGTPVRPRCGFTARIVELLSQIGLHYTPVNIMESDDVCEGLKEYSSWPTYPQVYIDGELIGGYDIVRSLLEDGTFTKMLKEKNLL